MSIKGFGIDDLQVLLGQYGELPVIFETGGTEINQGYHVTEVKRAAIRSIDCGRNTTEWNEVVIQLVDGQSMVSRQTANQVDRMSGQLSIEPLMSANKLKSIIDQAVRLFECETSDQLYFEFAPDNKPMLRLSVSDAIVEAGAFRVRLNAIHAACKPSLRTSNSTSKESNSQPCCGTIPATKAVDARRQWDGDTVSSDVTASDSSNDRPLNLKTGCCPSVTQNSCCA